MEMLFSLCHTTARLPDGWRAAAQAWKDNADNPELVEYILTVDEGNESHVQFGGSMFKSSSLIVNKGRKCCVDGWNLAAEHSTGKFIINIADDLFPCPHWDAELLKVIEANGGMDRPMALDVNTGGNHGLLTFCMVTRPYYNRFGYLLFPGYISVYSDNEFTDVARQSGCVVDARHLLFKHIHPLYNPEKDTDAIYEWQSRPEAWEIGYKLYKERSKVAGMTLKKKLALCLPGQNFSYLWVSNLIALMGYLMPRFDIVPILGYSSNVYVTRACLADSVSTCRPFPDYVVSIDDDNLLDPVQLDLLLQDLEQFPDIDIITGWSWIQNDAITSDAKVSCGFFDSKGTCVALKHEDLMHGSKNVRRIEWTGFPALVMRYSALIAAGGHKAFHPVPAPGHPYGFYGEDSSFCFNAKKADVKIFVDRRVRVPHLKLRDAEPIFATAEIKDGEKVEALA